MTDAADRRLLMKKDAGKATQSRLLGIERRN